MVIKNELIDEIRSKADIVDIVGRYVSLTKRGKNYFGVCPFHDDHSPSMSVSSEKQIYNCFSCGSGGNVFTFIKNYEHITFLEAVKKVADLIGEHLDIDDSAKQTNKNKSIGYELYLLSQKFYQNNLYTKNGIKARKYLNDRGFTDEIIKQFNIGLSNSTSLRQLLLDKGYQEHDLIRYGLTTDHHHDMFINRIMFPLTDILNHPVAFSGRIFDTTDPSKYINTGQTDLFKKGELLYNYYNVKHLNHKTQVIIMEGFMDVIKSASVGINNCIATMGTAMTHHHALLIKQLNTDVILMFDGDEAGNNATLSAIKELEQVGITPKIVRLDDNLDPDEYINQYGDTQLKVKIDNALSVIEYKMINYKRGKNLSDNNDIAQYIDLVINDLALVDDMVLRELSLNKLSHSFNVSKNILEVKLKNVTNNKSSKIIPFENKKLYLNKYERAQQMLIYYFINHNELIDMYSKNMVYMPTDIYRFLLKEIIYYYQHYGPIKPSDLISYLGDQENLITCLIGIINLDYQNEYSSDEIEDYIKVIKEYNIKLEQKRLTAQLKNEMDDLKKQELVVKLVSLRSESND